MLLNSAATFRGYMRARATAFVLLTFASYPALANPLDDAGKAEPSLLGPGLAERRGDQLVLTVDKGKQLAFTDNRKACDSGDAKNCAIYVLVANVPGSFAARKFESEGSDTTLIDAHSGRETLLTGVPFFPSTGGNLWWRSFPMTATIIWKSGGASRAG